MIIEIKNYAYKKLAAYVEAAEGEISGFGSVHYTPPKTGIEGELAGGTLTISDIDILPQEAGGAHATIDTKEYAKYVTEKIKKGCDIQTLRLWWHSHGHLQSFFSGTDTGTIETSKEFKWLVSLVVNKKGDMEARVDMHKPQITREIRAILLLEKEKGEKRFTKDDEEEIKKEVKKKVKVIKPEWPKTHWHGARSYAFEDEDIVGSRSEKLLNAPITHTHETHVYEGGVLVPISKKRAKKLWRRLSNMNISSMSSEEFRNYEILLQEDRETRYMGFYY